MQLNNTLTHLLVIGVQDLFPPIVNLKKAFDFNYSVQYKKFLLF